VFASGRIAMTDRYDAQLAFRFVNSSIDPYLKFVAPRMLPYTRAIATGSIQVAGPLGDYTHLRIDGRVEDASVTLVDYELHNERRSR